MTCSESDTFINNLIDRNTAFAIYRLPGENDFRFVRQQADGLSVYTDIESLNDANGFVVAPFHVSGECPVVLIHGEEEPLSLTGMEAPYYTSSVKGAYPPISGEYLRRFELFIQPLLDGELEKLVLSRQVVCRRSDHFSLATTFLKAAKRYIRSYVYLLYTPQTGIWLGSTPEILLSGKGTEWHTVALAGTQPLRHGRLPAGWNEKNVCEHRYVSTYIQRQLESIGINVREEGPYAVRAGELAHLKSDFRFKLSGNDKPGTILRLLYPTPAVCGLPKEKAYRFILDNEGHGREYYSGFVGMLNAHSGTNLYVNLRCMKVENQSLTLYAGGGLLASSVVEDEWQETEDKLYTMRAIID